MALHRPMSPTGPGAAEGAVHCADLDPAPATDGQLIFVTRHAGHWPWTPHVLGNAKYLFDRSVLTVGQFSVSSCRTTYPA
ncbi:hypothetical protein [Streptomyces sp. NPDC050738]|uniref:hypothetical protein n=1 Tax=Streptomyces sp. NPDC050738 TaxID=3154744 RepID=UPI003446DA9C